MTFTRHWLCCAWMVLIGTLVACTREPSPTVHVESEELAFDARTQARVIWTNAVGVTVDGNNLTKSIDNAWWGYSGASSLQSIAADGYVEITATENVTDRMFGLSYGDTDLTYADIDFAMELEALDAVVPGASRLLIFEGGIPIGGSWAYSVGDRLTISVTSSVVRYAKNGTVFYTSTRVPTFPLLVDTAFGTRASTIQNAVISGHTVPEPVVWTNAVGVTVDGNNLTKTVDNAWWGYSGATSAQSITGDGYVEILATENVTDRMFGLSHGNTDLNYADIDFAMELEALDAVVPGASRLLIFEGGIPIGGSWAYRVGDRLTISVTSSIVRYAKNGTVFYTSARVPTFPLLVDTAFGTRAATLRQATIFGHVLPGQAPVVWANATGVSIVRNSVIKTVDNDWWGYSGASSAQMIDGDGYVEITASDDSTDRVFGLSNGDSDLGWADIDFAIELEPRGKVVPGVSKLYVLEAGTGIPQTWTYEVGDRLRVSVHSMVVTYSKNGTVFYTSGRLPTFPLLVDTAFGTRASTISQALLSTHAWRLSPIPEDNTPLFDSVAQALRDGDQITLTPGTFNGRLRLRNRDGIRLRGAGTSCDVSGGRDCTLLTSESWSAPCPSSVFYEVCDLAQPLNPGCMQMQTGAYTVQPAPEDWQTLLLDGMTNTTVESLSVRNTFFVGYHGTVQGCTISTAVRIDSGGRRVDGAVIDRWSAVFGHVDIQSSGKNTLVAGRTSNGGDGTRAEHDSVLTMNNSRVSGGYFIFSGAFDDPCTSTRSSTANFNATTFRASMPQDVNHPMFSLYATRANFGSCAFWDDNDANADGGFSFDQNDEFAGHTQKAIFSAHACTSSLYDPTPVEIQVDRPTGNLGAASGWLNLNSAQNSRGAHLVVTGPSPANGVDPAPFMVNDPGYNGREDHLAAFGHVLNSYVTRFPSDVTVFLGSCSASRGTLGPERFGIATDTSMNGNVYSYHSPSTNTWGDFPFPFECGGNLLEPNAYAQIWRPESRFSSSVATLIASGPTLAADITYTDSSCSGLGCTPVSYGGSGYPGSGSTGCGVLERTWKVVEHLALPSGAAPKSRTYLHTQQIVFVP